MARKKEGDNTVGWVIGIGVAALLVKAIVKGVSSSRDTDTPEPINRVVDWLNRTFGHNWLPIGVAALSKAMPAPMAGLVNVIEAVYEAEQQGKPKDWSGQQRYQYAAARC
ncbi:MAG: hypothetical protein JNM40_19670 [Myxococcales bacterium]|nr:hypothetical protein [Myxococcales bacterium]